jgi:hypothetical protein
MTCGSGLPWTRLKALVFRAYKGVLGKRVIARRRRDLGAWRRTPAVDDRATPSEDVPPGERLRRWVDRLLSR